MNLNYLIFFFIGVITPGIIEAIVEWLPKTIKHEQLPPKDPEDHTLTKSSTPWQVDEYSCTHTRCGVSCNHNEYTSGICNSCGNKSVRLHYRSYRKIINAEGNWVYQYKYPTHSIIVDKKL